MSHEHDWYQYPNLMLENVVTVICTLCGKIAEQRPMRRMTGLRVDPDGTRHSVWTEEGAAQPHTMTQTLSGTLLAAKSTPYHERSVKRPKVTT